MSSSDVQRLGKDTFKRTVKRKLGLFIDGTGLDRATRRLDRKVDMSRLVAGLSSGLKPEVARYYTLVPYEDDARQFAFLDAVERAGMKVIVKRLPPKGVTRQVSMDVHMASDIIAFCYGLFEGGAESDTRSALTLAPGEESAPVEIESVSALEKPTFDGAVKRIATVVCPSRELAYAIDMAHRIGGETTLADFGLYGQSDGWRGVDRWVDLSTSETIWRD